MPPFKIELIKQAYKINYKKKLRLNFKFTFNITLSLLVSFLIASCSPKGFDTTEKLAEQTAQDIACKNPEFETRVWDGLKNYVLENGELPSINLFTKRFDLELKKLASTENFDKFQTVRDLIIGIYKTLITDSVEDGHLTSASEILQHLSALDVGDQSTELKSRQQKLVHEKLNTLKLKIQQLDVETDCSNQYPQPITPQPIAKEPNPILSPSHPLPFPTPTPSAPEPSSTDSDVEKNFLYHYAKALEIGLSNAAFGTHWVLATAYQNCQATQLAPLNSRTQDIKGIAITGKHTNGVGNKRIISSLSDLQSTHYYLQNSSSADLNQCYSVFNNPLIYDYGGKPSATTALNSPLNFFKNAGSGTSVLGIDCSGFIFSSLAAAGLKLQAGRPLKASDVWAWGSSSYLDPQKNGLTCLEKITLSPEQSINSGDIVAINGHILLIDKIENDPFGIQKIKKVEDCNNIDYRQFHFVIAQSSPSKGGIGINYYEAADYLTTSDTIREGLIKYASYACRSTFDNKSYRPDVATLSILRHKGTKECLAPRVKLSYESCIQSCPHLF